MEFRILGAMEVLDGTRLARIPSGRGRALLALLVLRAGEVVPTDRLIDELWGEQPPPTAFDGAARPRVEAAQGARGRYHRNRRQRVQAARRRRRRRRVQEAARRSPCSRTRRARATLARSRSAVAWPAPRRLHLPALRPARDRRA